MSPNPKISKDWQTDFNKFGCWYVNIHLNIWKANKIHAEYNKVAAIGTSNAYMYKCQTQCFVIMLTHCGLVTSYGVLTEINIDDLSFVWSCFTNMKMI